MISSEGSLNKYNSTFVGAHIFIFIKLFLIVVFVSQKYRSVSVGAEEYIYEQTRYGISFEMCCLASCRNVLRRGCLCPLPTLPFIPLGHLQGSCDTAQHHPPLFFYACFLSNLTSLYLHLLSSLSIVLS